jgi:carbon-monoxide dehydrogenase large subunit
MRPYRGNGRPEAAYVIERMVDLAGAEMGVDPAELRRRNYVPPAAMPFKTGLTFTYDSGEFEKNMDLAIELADRKSFKMRKAGAHKRGKLLGLGISNTIERAGAPSTEGAEVRFDRSGSLLLFSGSNSQGQGHETVFKQLVCDRLGIDPHDAQYVQGDTDQVFYGEGTGGSRSATLAGSAFHLATKKVVTKARAIAAHILKVELSDLKFDEGVFSTNKTNRTLSIKEIAVASLDIANLPKDMEPGLFATAVYNTPVNNYPNGCHICELEIDRETGKVDITRYSVVDDFGTVLNPLLLHGQVHGGIAQGVGQVLMENIYFDDAGQLVTASFMDYAMPHAHDLCDMDVESNPVPTKTNPLGVKGAGEAGCVGALPAVTNAIIDALSEFGVRHIEMPATPERIWRAMQPK